MKHYLNKLPKDMLELVYLAGEVAGARGDSAYLVGGIVRDLILGVANLDLDVVIQGDGLRFASDFSRRIGARLVTHPRFGTATIITPGKIKMDIATCRREVYPEPASLPAVSPGTIAQDLARRDFTINALAIDLLPGSFGQLVDFNQGRQDLRNKVIRVLHDLSFIDDPTRIFRAVRFEQRLKFKIEPHSLKLLKQAASKGMLKLLSPHRLKHELVLILSEPQPLRYILRLKGLAGLDFIHRKIRLGKTNLKYLKSIKNEINWFNNNFPQYSRPDAWLMYFIGLLDNLNIEQIKQVSKRLNLRKQELNAAVSYKKFSGRLASRLSKKDIPPSQVYLNLESLSPEVILLVKAKYANKKLSFNIAEFFRRYLGIKIYVRGRDLTGLGLAPGPGYKKVLTRLLRLQLDGKVRSRQEALREVKKWRFFRQLSAKRRI